MKNNLILETSHLLLEKIITPNDVIIDATMGNGNDTLFLAKHSCFVYAFDIQQQALDETRSRLETQQIKNVKLILDSHENFEKYVTDFKGVIFNLGYLPKGNKSITTKKEITLQTISKILPLLKKNGFIQLVIYSGHPEGLIESEAIQLYLSKLNLSLYKILKIELPFQDNNPPYIMMIYKVKDESI
ncbi:MAG: class I SAM-dependent methyltransferase [Acholeplasmataceae bacterium]|nr:class I SAM-dependent methyltransferase [Acholeplasmataceae bacterium]